MVNKYLCWSPRILSILLILFLFSFSFDVFEPGLSIKEMLLGFLIHNIPTLILIIVLIISWKYEIVGSIVFILIGILYIIWVLNPENLKTTIAWSLIIAGPAFLIGVLFLINWFAKRK